MSSLLERHSDKIRGVISCFDRVVIHGALPGICYAAGMTSYLHRHNIRIFDYPHFAQGLRDEVRANAERLAKDNGVQIEFVRKASFSKEKRIKQVLAERGTHPGLVHILSAMEGCAAYKPWHDKETHKTFLRPDSGQCLHYYFYFIDPKYGRVLRIETTTNDVSFFRHHRMVDHRGGTSSFNVAPLRKTIYSLRDLRSLLAAANTRYLDFISGIEDPTAPTKLLDKVSRPATHGGRRYKGFNFFAELDQRLFEVILRGEHTISGMRNRHIRRLIPELSAAQVSRHLKRLRTHGLIKRVSRTYKYYLTKAGRTVALAGLKLRSLVLIPDLGLMAPS